jgi:hypothetical protein
VRKKIFARKPIHLIASLGAGLLLGAFLAIFSFIHVDARTSAASVYQKNEAGQTYGSEKLATSFETEPDLIAAVGTNGAKGYVKVTDLYGELPKTPQEAVSKQKLRKSKAARRISLYEKDGTTVIGEFELSSGNATLIQ